VRFNANSDEFFEKVALFGVKAKSRFEFTLTKEEYVLFESQGFRVVSVTFPFDIDSFNGKKVIFDPGNFLYNSTYDVYIV